MKYFIYTNYTLICLSIGHSILYRRRKWFWWQLTRAIASFFSPTAGPCCDRDCNPLDNKTMCSPEGFCTEQGFCEYPFSFFGKHINVFTFINRSRICASARWPDKKPHRRKIHLTKTDQTEAPRTQTHQAKIHQTRVIPFYKEHEQKLTFFFFCNRYEWSAVVKRAEINCWHAGHGHVVNRRHKTQFFPRITKSQSQSFYRFCWAHFYWIGIWTFYQGMSVIIMLLRY